MNHTTSTARERIALDWNQLLGFNQVQATEKTQANPARAMVGGKLPAVPELNRHALLAAKVGAKAGIKAG